MAINNKEFSKKLNIFDKNIKGVINKATNTRRMRLLSKLAIQIIKERTRFQQKGVAINGAVPTKLKKVSPEYSEYRRKLKRKSKLAATGLDSNLTLTGKLLNQMRTIKANKRIAVIGWRNPEQINKAFYQEKQGRTFLNLANSEVILLSKALEKELKKLGDKI